MFVRLSVSYVNLLFGVSVLVNVRNFVFFSHLYGE